MSRVNLGIVRDPNFAAKYARDPNNPYRKASDWKNTTQSGRTTKWTSPGSAWTSPAQQRRDLVGGVGGALTGIAGAAATSPALVAAYPAIAPVAAGLGIGYGIYKLGESFKLW